MAAISEYILEMKNIKKHFGGIKALEHVQLQVKKGEVHALLGENGAGKSTLMKILGGSYVMDDGEICIDGQMVDISSPVQSQRQGVAVIYQEQALVDCLTVADNIMLGRIPGRMGVVDQKEHYRHVEEALEQVGAKIDPNEKVGSLGVAGKQFVEIAKAVSMDAKIIVMDEPTAVLTLPETEMLFKLIRQLKSQGRSIIYISHRLEELVEIADRCTVLKDGTYVGTRDMADVTKDMLITMMTGREIKDIYPAKQAEKGEISLEVKNLTKKGSFKNISFSLRKGEVVGFSGLVGSGRSEVARAVFGIDSYDAGEICLDGKPVRFCRAEQALAAGIVYITEDRKGDGLFLGMTIGDNITISTLKRIAKGGVVHRSQERDIIQEYLEKLQVKCSDATQVVGELSGGNQQKVMIARAMLSKAKVIIVDEPTRGVDVGTKTEIYKIVRNMADQGCAVWMISSELPEVIGLSDRILVMHGGRITGELRSSEATEETILAAATGGNG